MSFELRPFGKEQASEAAQIFLSAYADNPFHKILFPNGMGQATRDKIYSGLLESADDPDSHLLQLYDTEAGKMAAFAVWSWTKPVSDEEWKWKLAKRLDSYPDARQEIVRPFVVNEMTAKQKIMGNGRWWELQILSVDYKYQRKGLGGRLIEWGTDELERRQVPSIIVATQAGYGLYMKSGFVTQDTWDEDLSRWGGSGSYMNAVLTRYPQETGKAEAKAAETD